MNTILFKWILLAKNAVLTKEFELSFKVSKFKFGDRVRITKCKNIYNWWKEKFVIDSVLKTKPWTYKIKDLNW